MAPPYALSMVKLKLHISLHRVLLAIVSKANTTHGSAGTDRWSITLYVPKGYGAR